MGPLEADQDEDTTGGKDFLFFNLLLHDAPLPLGQGVMVRLAFWSDGTRSKGTASAVTKMVFFLSASKDDAE